MTHTIHPNHDHVHGPGCGHAALRHSGHVDYLHDGDLHHAHDGHVDECAIEAGTTNPVACTPSHRCTGHAQGHAHGNGCGHDSLPHGDHTDYLVAGHLHHPHAGHCDDHGVIQAT